MKNLQAFHACVLASLAVALSSLGYGAPGDTELVSVRLPGQVTANGPSRDAALSADGRYIAFSSEATDLVKGGTTTLAQIFVRNLQTGVVERVSVTSSEKQANGYSFGPAMSADGRYVAFLSNASNLAADDTTRGQNVFVRDRQAGVTEQISSNSELVQGSWVSISADGRYVAYAARRTLGAVTEVFMRDRLTQQTEKISVNLSGGAANGYSVYPSISADGRYVAFASQASNLVAGDDNAQNDIFVRDRQTAQTSLVSIGTSGQQTNLASTLPRISADGRYVAFLSAASNLTAGDANGVDDVFIRDRQAGLTEMIGSSGEQTSASSVAPSISADGRYVAFESVASNLVPGDDNGKSDVFVRDRQTGQTARVSIASAGEQGDGESGGPSISSNGRYVGFSSEATNLISPDTNDQRSDIFVRDRQTSTLKLASASRALSGAGEGSLFDVNRTVSGDGRFVAFWSFASNLVPGDDNKTFDIFVRDRQTAQNERVSLNSSGEEADDSSLDATITPDGRYVAFDSLASNLVTGDDNGVEDVFVRDRQTGQTERVSVTSSGAQVSSASSLPTISADGRFVAFVSSAFDLVPNDTNNADDAFVRDRQTGQTERVSVSSSGVQANSGSNSPAISADGRYVAFFSRASSLGVGPAIYVRDRQTGQTDRVGGATDNHFAISADSRYVAFASLVNIVSGDNNFSYDIYLTDRQTGQTQLMSAIAGLGSPNGASFYPSISADGRYVTFNSEASNLVPGDTNGQVDVFVRDRLSSRIWRASVSTTGVQGNEDSTNPSISGDGRHVAFTSFATNLTADDDVNRGPDVYIHELTPSEASFLLTPPSLYFGAQVVGTSSTPRAIKVKNTGTVPLPITAIALGGLNPGQFSRTMNCGAALAVGAACNVYVVFKPKGKGKMNALLSVYAGAGAGTQSVQLAGTGVLP